MLNPSKERRIIAKSCYFLVSLKKDWEYNNGKVELIFQFFLKLWHATQKVGFFLCYWKRQNTRFSILEPVHNTVS